MTPPSVSPADAQFVVSALAVVGIQKAKGIQGFGKLFPGITRDSDRLNRAVAIAISFAGSVGINATFHAGVLTVSNLNLATAFAAVIFFGRSVAGQEVMYRLVKMSSHLSELTTTLAALAIPQGDELPPSATGSPDATDARKTWNQVAAETKNPKP